MAACDGEKDPRNVLLLCELWTALPRAFCGFDGRERSVATIAKTAAADVEQKVAKRRAAFASAAEELYDVVAEYDEWCLKRSDAAAATLEAVRCECCADAFSVLRQNSRRAARRVIAPDAWLEAADELLGADLVEDLVVSLPDVALREALADALEARGRPLDGELWVNDVF